MSERERVRESERESERERVRERESERESERERRVNDLSDYLPCGAGSAVVRCRSHQLLTLGSASGCGLPNDRHTDGRIHTDT